jgi:hypothetical protein
MMYGTMPSARAIYSIDSGTLKRFNALYPPRQRSQVIERFMNEAVDRQEAAVLSAAVRIETEARFKPIREVSADVDRIAGEGFQRP